MTAALSTTPAPVPASGRAIQWDTWALQEEADRRFRRLVWRILLPLLLIGLVIPYVKMAQRERAIAEETTRYAELLKPVPPPPKKEEPKPPEPEKKAPEKPKLTQEQKVAKAQAKAKKMLSQFDQLAALREANLPKIDSALAPSVITSKSGTGNPSFANSATAGSGGIGELGVVERGATTGLGDRTTGRVRSTIGGGRDRGVGGKPTRTLEEIQLVFDRNKGAFYSMYVREQRQRPDMVGKLVVKMTIAPSGQVTKCTIVSSELNHPEFEKKVVARVMLMDFGAKNVGDFTLDYPILFFPS